MDELEASLPGERLRRALERAFERWASPGVRHFAHASASARAALADAIDRASAADTFARAQEWLGAVAGGLALLGLLALGTGCGVDANPDKGANRVFANLRGTGTEPAPAAREPVDASTWEWPPGPHPHATLAVAGRGEIEIELFPELAPKTVANFLELAGRGFYDGVAFHRVIAGFMVQTGDPNTRDDLPDDDGMGGPGYTIEDEFGDAPHVRGVVSMANTGRPDSGGSQFFIVQRDRQALDGKYAVFGRVVRGMDVVDAIAEAPTDLHGRWGPRDRPLEAIRIAGVHVATPTADTHAAAAPAH